MTAELGNIHQIADAALSNGEAEMSDRHLTTHGPGSWDANPWVWAVEFKRGS